MALKPGTLDDFDDSLAEAIEQAFAVVWTERMGAPLPEQMRDDRRMMFVAIAQGVVKHLRDRAPGAFAVDVDVTQSDPWISSSGTATSGGHTHPVSVTQGANDANRVHSEGSATVTIQTSGTVY